MGNKIEVAMLISDKNASKSKIIPRDNEQHYIMPKGSLYQEDITMINIYAPNIRASKYMKQTWTEFKKAIDNKTITVRDPNTTWQGVGLSLGSKGYIGSNKVSHVSLKK